MRLRALAATLVLPLGLLAACNDDDAGLSVRAEDTASDTAASDSTEASDTTESTEASATTEDRTTTSEDDDDTTTSEDNSSTTEDDSSSTSDDDSDTTPDGGTAATYPAVIRDALVNALEAQGMTAEQAECAVGIIEERVPYEDFIAGDISAVFDDMGEFGEEMIDECGIEPGQVGGVSATTTG